MKKLSRVVLVQWYRFEAQDVPILGNVAVVGENGSGKSAFLDAIQTVLTGGNKNLLVLNRGSNEQSSRKLREYVLGFLGDANIPPRPSANCYLALNFYDEETQETMCIGVAISASISEADDRIEGRFIAPNLVGSKDLFLGTSPGGLVSLPWAQVKDRLERACPGVRFSHSADSFIRDVYATLSADPTIPNNHRDVVKALRAALRLEKINDPSEFIRKYMLERDDLQVQELRASLQNYRDIEEKTLSVKNRIAELSEIDSMCSKIEAAKERQSLLEWVSLHARQELVVEKAEPLRDRIQSDEETLVGLEGKKKTWADNQQACRDALSGKKYELDNLDVTVKKERLTLDLREAKQKWDENHRGIQSVLRRLREIEKQKIDGLPLELNEAMRAAIGCLPSDDMLEVQAWPREPAKLDRVLVDLFAAAKANKSALEATHERLSAQKHKLDQELTRLVQEIRALEGDKSPLSPDTRGLITALQRKGIEAYPLCSLVDVSQPEWRDTIESILGGLREALVIDPSQVEEALTYFRREGRRDFPSGRIVTTTQSSQWQNRVQPGSLAEYVATDNPHAQAFINRQLGNIIRVDTEKGLLSHERAATADGMLTTGGYTSSLKTVSSMLGRGSREHHLETRRKNLDTLSDKKRRVEDDQQQASRLLRVVDALTDTGFPSMGSLVSDRDAAKSREETITREIEELSQDARSQTLTAEISKLTTRIAEIGGEITALDAKGRDLERRVREDKSALEQLDKALRSIDEVIADVRKGMDSAKAADLLDRYREASGGDMEQVRARAESERQTTQAVIAKTGPIFARMSEYHVKYQSEEGRVETPPETVEEIAAMVRDRKRRLEETTLAEYQEKAQKTTRDMEETFRAKFIGRLVDKISSVKHLILHLNKTLEKNPFHGGEVYRFYSHPNPEFKHVIDYANAVQATGVGEFGGLFDPANEAGSPYAAALEAINKALLDPREAERFQDYRNYLVFEVKMFRNGQEVGTLDERIKKGSGGETQTPFYVAIGSSLAAAYRLRHGGDAPTGGMNLAIFDEAFSKLSVHTCQQCVAFLERIGLQLLLAAPDSKAPEMSAIMDQVLWLDRDGGNVEILNYRIKPELRALLQSDNPYRQSVGEVGDDHFSEE